MKLNAIKGVPIIVIGTALMVYAMTVLGHLYLEYSYSQSTLHDQESILALLPGTQVAEDNMTFYCVDEAVAGSAVGPDRWSEKNCETGPARRVTIYSRYMRKYWNFYINQENKVAFKSSWVVL